MNKIVKHGSMMLVFALSSCTITKKYHSFGYQIDWQKQSHIEATAKRNSNSQQSNVDIATSKVDLAPSNKIIGAKSYHEFELFQIPTNQLETVSKYTNICFDRAIKVISTDSTKPQISNTSKEIFNPDAPNINDFRAEKMAENAMLLANIGQLLIYTVFLFGIGVILLLIANNKANRAAKLTPYNAKVLKNKVTIHKIGNTILTILAIILLATIIGLILLIHVP